ncbi:MAG: methyltransferase domain-containing protein, partial [Planctomycetota bacterium]
MPDILPFDRADSDPMLLNIGCGRHFDDRWQNLDIESSEPGVIVHDVTRGIPFETGSFDAVYHSHLLEHLKPHLGRALMADCLRVLKPGGVLRIVVPDLERIAELYLQKHHCAWNGDDDAAIDYNWMKLELLDQLVRECSGGRMGSYMASPEIKNSDFVRSRVGDEFKICRGTETYSKAAPIRPGLGKRFSDFTRRWREKLSREFVRLMLGRNGAAAFDEGVFRSRGEIHRWMYDRYSLRELCHSTGFRDFRVLSATDSGIESYRQYRLDSV